LSDALRSLKSRYKDRLEIVMFGWCPDELIGIVGYHPPVHPSEYLKKLHSLNLGIGLIPCADNLFNRSKSITKLLEYGIVSIPTIICSAHKPYINLSDDIRMLLFCQDGDWLEYLEILCMDVQGCSREDFGQKERLEDVRKNYLIEDHVYKIADTYQKIYEGAKR